MLQVQQHLCLGCAACVDVCPLAAIRIKDDRAWIDPALCDGCGACVAACPQGAIQEVPEPAWAASAEGVDKYAPAQTRSSSAQEIIHVQLPPPPAVRETEAPLSRRVLPLVGAALGFLGREVGPKLVNLAVDLLEQRLSQPADEKSPVGSRSEGQALAGRDNARVSGGRGRQRRIRGRGQRRRGK